jgi:hypothetical protein
VTLQERIGQPAGQPTPRTEPWPPNAQAAPDDGTPTNDSAAALHWAAVAVGLADARTQQGNPLPDTERAAHDRNQGAARAPGHTEEQVREYLDGTIRPAVNG